MNNEFTGKTIEEAVKEGLKALGLTEECAEITVIEEPQKGFLGIGSKPAKVSVTKKKTDVDNAVEFLDGLFNVLNITATTEVAENEEGKVVLNLIATDSSQLIGYRGEVLDSIQCLASAVYNSGKENYSRLVVDCEGYRGKREETLKNLALKLAAKAVKTGRKVVLEPMNPFERRIIHSTLVDFEGVKTASEGKEPNRYIAIIPDNYDPTRRNDKYNARRNDGYNRNNKNGRRQNGGKGFDKFDKRGGRSFDRKPSAPRAKSTGFGNAVFLGNSQKTEQPKTEDNE